MNPLLSSVNEIDLSVVDVAEGCLGEGMEYFSSIMIWLIK